MLKSDSLTDSDTFEKGFMVNFIWDGKKSSMVIDAYLVISIHRFITDGIFQSTYIELMLISYSISE